MTRGSKAAGRFRFRLSGAPRLLLCLCLAPLAATPATTGLSESLASRYESFLLLQAEDYETVEAVSKVFRNSLLRRFRRGIRNANRFQYDQAGVPAIYAAPLDTKATPTAEDKAREDADRRMRRLITDFLPTVAYAYLVPGPDDEPSPYFGNPEVLQLYLSGLEYCYGRGLTEDAWLPDHAGRASAKALELGLERPYGDLSELSLRLGGISQSIFLMREHLADAGLLDKYRSVVRNLAVNNGTMYPAFFHTAREEAGVKYARPLPIAEQYGLNADGVRLFADTFWPYYLLIEDPAERSLMTAVLSNVIAANIAVKPGVQGTIKPDGTGFHHGGAYVGAYTPGAFESFAQLLYLSKETGFAKPSNVEALRLALDSYRVMVQKYALSSSLRGRLISGTGQGVTDSVSKAMVFLGHPDGMDDSHMRARFGEFFREEDFFADGRDKDFYEGGRGVTIRGLGIYRLIDDLQSLSVVPAETPSGVWIKPYAAAAFFRRNNWLVTAKGFSQYFWDHESELGSGENSFGQNWANGLLHVFSTGDPVSDKASGYDLANGWDWYHVPGTTASHYPIEKRVEKDLRARRKSLGIVQRDVHRNYNTRTFVGGVTIGEHGFFAQDLEALPFTAPTNLSGRKTYFFVGDRVLALGTHIRGGTEREETHTTLFQTKLQDALDVTWVNGEQEVGLGTETRFGPESAVNLADSVGNSYCLIRSSAELVVSRKVQQSLTVDYKPSEGAYALAYLNHGINPQGDSYEYVVIPNDGDVGKLLHIVERPDHFYQVLETGKMHLVHFPEQGIGAYAFYEVTETPSSELVRSVDRPAAVITQQEGDSVVLAASVPDIGWEFDSDIVSQGLTYAMKHFTRQQAKAHVLSLALRGQWQVDESPDGTASSVAGSDTVVEIPCGNGLSSRIVLSPLNLMPGESAEGDEAPASGRSEEDSLAGGRGATR